MSEVCMTCGGPHRGDEPSDGASHLSPDQCITTLRAQLAEARAEAEAIDGVLRGARVAVADDGGAVYSRLGRVTQLALRAEQDFLEMIATRNKLTAAEAAREAVAEQVRDGAVRLCEKALKTIPPKSMAAAEVFHLSRLIGAMALPTAALQRVREEAAQEFIKRMPSADPQEAERRGAERALRDVITRFDKESESAEVVREVMRQRGVFPAPGASGEGVK